MNIELYPAFVAACMVLIAIPGPNVALIITSSLAHGPRAGLMTVAGTNTAQTLQLAVTVAGLASLLAVAASGFETLRWLGVAYLAYLGLRALKSARTEKSASRDMPVAGPVGVAPGKSIWSFYWRGFAVAFANPKTLLFLLRFFRNSWTRPYRPLSSRSCWR